MGALYIRLVYSTSRWDTVGGDIVKQYQEEGRPLIVCFWHSRILMEPKAWSPKYPFHMLISSHGDGQLISKTVSHFGISTIAGSTNRGGMEALRIILKFLKKGHTIGVTPDGPRGPRFRASEGISQISRLSQVPVIPLAFSSTRAKVLGSWDRFMIPFPFGRGVFVWGELIHPKVFESSEEQRLAIEQGLRRVTERADQICNNPETYTEPA